MNWLKEQIYKLAESITHLSSVNFFLSITLGTFALTYLSTNFFYIILDAIDKSDLLPDKPGLLLISLYLSLWIVITLITSTVIFTLGGKLIRYDISSDRLDFLTKSGLISKTRKRIWLIGLSLYPFATEGWFNIFEKKIQEGVSVRLLVLDPSSGFAKERYSSLSNNHFLSDDINEAIDKFKEFKRKIEKYYPKQINQFEIRLYNGNASMSCFILDEEARVGFYMKERTGLSAPEIRVNNRTSHKEFFKMFECNFQLIWDSSANA